MASREFLNVKTELKPCMHHRSKTPPILLPSYGRKTQSLESPMSKLGITLGLDCPVEDSPMQTTSENPVVLVIDLAKARARLEV